MPRHGYPEEVILDQHDELPESPRDRLRAEQYALGTSYGMPRHAQNPELPFPFNYIERTASKSEKATVSFLSKIGSFMTTRLPELLSRLQRP